MATNPLNLSDEDFLNQSPPETEGASGISEDTTNNADNIQTEPENTEVKTDAEAAAPEPVVEPKADPEPTAEEPKKKPVEGEEAPEAEPKKDAEKAPEGTAPKEAEPAKPESTAPTGSEQGPTPEAAQEFYSKIMAPIRANGKDIQVKNADEAIALMQMGANYTRKLQELAPARKLAVMAQNNGIDEGKLSFLIDLDKGDPEAVKKFMKDRNIDPMDIDTSVEPAYREGSHTVSDQEVNFRNQMEEVRSSPTGQETIQIFNTWDQSSKDMLWENPEVMPIIHAQRENGIYTKITEEMDRQIALGQISATTPFIQAYQIVGDQLAKAGVFGEMGGDSQTSDKIDAPVPAQAEKVPIATTTAAPTPLIDNGDNADAAAASRTAPGKAKEFVNFLAMSDDDFKKSDYFRNRV